MLVGFAQYDITPAVGKLIPGGFAPCHTSEPARGKLYATAMALTSGEDTAILVSADTLSMQISFAERLRERISAATGVPRDLILIASTHTHTGGATDYQLWLCPPDEEVAGLTEKGVYEAALAAFEARRPATIGCGVGEESRYSFCRDYYMRDGNIKMNPSRATAEDIDKMIRPVDVPDHSVNVLRIDDAEGEPRGFVVNYANHPDCHQRNKSSFSADFPGALRRNLRRIYGEDIFVLFFNGTAGDINCLDFKGGRHLAYYGGTKNAPEAIGAGLCSTVVDISTRIEAEDDEPKLRAISRNVVLDRRYKTQADYEWAKKIAEDMASHKIMDQAFATEYLESDDNVQPTIDFEIHTLRLGPWAIVGLPSEIFTDIGRRIKRASPFDHTVIFELANGTHGYISTRTLHNSTAYEAKVSKYNACTAADSADRIVEAAIAQLRELYAMED